MQNDILQRLGRAQAQMILANINGNKEAEEHYKQIQIETVKEFSKTKPEKK